MGERERKTDEIRESVGWGQESGDGRYESLEERIRGLTERIEGLER